MAKITDPDDLTYSVNSATNILRLDVTDPDNPTIEFVEGGAFTFSDGVTGQCLFSKLKIIIREHPGFTAYRLPIREMIHDESMELLGNWKFKNTASLKSVRDCGIAYVNSSSVITNMYACFNSLGELPVGATDIATAIYFAQSVDTNASTGTFTHVHTGQTFGVNELVEIYRDTNGDGTADFDYRAYAKLFLRPKGYTFDEASNSDVGYPVMTYKKYNFPLTSKVDEGVTVTDDAVLDAYTGMSIAWSASPLDTTLDGTTHFTVHVDIVANGKTHAETYSWVQRQLRKTTDIDLTGGTPRYGNVAAALAFMDGDTLTTKLQSAGGVRITGISAASYNFVSMVSDAGLFYTYPYTAAITFEFDEFLQLDTGVAKYWIYDAATYPGVGATMLQNASGVDMTGTISGPTVSFSYKPPGAWADKAWVGVAVGDDDGKIAVASGVIEQSTANKGVFVAGKERWKI